VRSLIASIACVVALTVAAVPAAAAPVDGRADPQFTPALQVKPRPTPVVHEIHTVIRERDAGRTLALVLAGAALLIATASAAYSTVRVSGRPARGALG
jgi:hypothetical protein